MTIKELESRTGMTRANIRFYEGEGLLSPKRLDNGYRDYSEEDARTLEKIKLLRQLQLDIDTIRKVQQGALTLEQALFTQMTKLEGDKAVIERAAQVCRELERSGVEYAALEPQPWLSQLQAPARPGLPEPPAAPAEDVRNDEPLACYHPWMRLMARGLDISLYDALINVVWLLITRDMGFQRLQTANFLTQWVWGLLMLVLALLLEPLWLHYWGWTPGKWIFGLKLRDESGNKLSISDARWRCWELASAGYGWDIPILSQYRMWKCREAGLNGKDCDWDWGLRYTKEYRRFSGPVYVAAGAVCIAALALSGLWSELPVNRGDLTVAEFSQNYNEAYRRLERANYVFPALDSAIPTLDEDGGWVGQETFDGPMVAYGETTRIFDWDGTVYVIEDPVAGTTVWDRPEFTMEDGRITAVTLRVESRDSMFQGSDLLVRTRLAVLAMSGAVDGVNLFNYDLGGWLTAGDGLPAWEDGETDYRGLHISQQVEYEGYQVSGGALWQEGDGDAYRHCEKTVTISLIE